LRESETKAFLEKAKGIYSRVPTNEFAVEIWQKVLKNVDYDKCCKALIKYVTDEGRNDPKPGDILRLATSDYGEVMEHVKAPCDKCHGSGYIFLIDKFKHESVGACDCQNGKDRLGLPMIKKISYKFDEFGRVTN